MRVQFVFIFDLDCARHTDGCRQFEHGDDDDDKDAILVSNKRKHSQISKIS